MTTPHTSGAADLPAIQRYKIGYHSDDWGQRSSTPSGIPDASGSWVRYEDHIAALAAGQATAAQQGAAYAELPTHSHAGRVYEEGFLIGTCPLYTADQMRSFADATYMLRASHGQASSQAGEYPALVCDYCGALTPDPWHSSGMLHGKMSKHIHSCDACAARGAVREASAQPAAQQGAAYAGMGHTDGGRNMFYEGRFDGESQREQQARLRWANDMRAAFERHTGNGWFDKDWRTETGLWSSAWYACLAAQPTTTAQSADSVQEDVARLDFLIEQRAYVVSDPDACPGHWLHWAMPDGRTWVQGDEHQTPRAAIDAARKQGARWQSAVRALTLHI